MIEGLLTWLTLLIGAGVGWFLCAVLSANRAGDAYWQGFHEGATATDDCPLADEHTFRFDGP